MGRILVIEDDPGTRLLLQSRLEDLGHEVATAPTGAMGLMEARAERFDLFLVDVVLGAGVDGYEVCRRLKGMPQTHGVPVVLVSGKNTDRGGLHYGYEAGCEAFLIKGDMLLLEDVIRAMLRIKSLQDDLGLQNRLLEEQNRRLQEEQQRGADLELALRESGARALVFRELAAGRPDGLLVVDGDGIIRFADRGALDILGVDLESRHLGAVAPGSGLEAFVRDARTEAREGFRFDLPARAGKSKRSLTGSVMPMVPKDGSGDHGLRALLLLDAGRRKVAAEILRMQEQGLPRREVGPLLEAARTAFHAGAILGVSKAMLALRSNVSRAAAADMPVLIAGASGTGKELAARAIHFGGKRSGSFAPVNCGALSPTVLAAELFGHVKGAFTGAFSDRPGLFLQAHMGTVLLDQIDRLPVELQPQVLRLLTSGEFTRVGSRKVEETDVRVLATTDADLAQMVADGQFDAELYDRVSAMEIRIPTLRERPEDVPVLVQHFLQRYGAPRERVELSEEALWALESYDWPGNVRELEGCIERACATTEGDALGVDDLTQPLRELFRQLSTRSQIPAVQRRVVAEPGARVAYGTRRPASDGRPLRRQPQPVFAAAAADGANPADPALATGPVSLEFYEKQALLRALEETHGDRLKAAKLLNVGKSTLYRKLKRHGIK